MLQSFPFTAIVFSIWLLMLMPSDVAAKPPNIVIMADDIGAGELACYGHREHRTPVLDRLGREGVRFETCFTSPVCHPTRFMLMTGQ